MRNIQPPAKAPTTPSRMSSRMPSPLRFTILLPMNPAIRPRTIQARNDMLSPDCPVHECSDEGRPYAPAAHEQQSATVSKIRYVFRSWIIFSPLSERQQCTCVALCNHVSRPFLRAAGSTISGHVTSGRQYSESL